MKKISYSAPAKIILSGEHTVGYGKPALVTAINKRLYVTLRESEKRVVDAQNEKAIDFIEDIVIKHIRKSKDIGKKSFSLEITSDIPQGRGMGSSAAYCVAVTAALLEFYTDSPSEKKIVHTHAFKAEDYFHGMQASGIDVSASCMGGLVYYRREFEFLKLVSALNFKIPQHIQNSLILIDTGAPSESTAEMIKIVGTRYNEFPKEMEHATIEIEKCTKRMVISIVKEDLTMFQEAIKDNQRHLISLGIVSGETSSLLDSLSSEGVGKVTGAGGVKEGSGIVLFSATKENIEQILTQQNINYSLFQQDFEGLRRE